MKWKTLPWRLKLVVILTLVASIKAQQRFSNNRKHDRIQEWIRTIKQAPKGHSLSPSWNGKSPYSVIGVNQLPLQNEAETEEQPQQPLRRQYQQQLRRRPQQQQRRQHPQQQFLEEEQQQFQQRPHVRRTLRRKNPQRILSQRRQQQFDWPEQPQQNRPQRIRRPQQQQQPPPEYEEIQLEETEDYPVVPLLENTEYREPPKRNVPEYSDPPIRQQFAEFGGNPFLEEEHPDFPRKVFEQPPRKGGPSRGGAPGGPGPEPEVIRRRPPQNHYDIPRARNPNQQQDLDINAGIPPQFEHETQQRPPRRRPNRPNNNRPNVESGFRPNFRPSEPYQGQQAKRKNAAFVPTPLPALNVPHQRRTTTPRPIPTPGPEDFPEPPPRPPRPPPTHPTHPPKITHPPEHFQRFANPVVGYYPGIEDELEAEDHGRFPQRPQRPPQQPQRRPPLNDFQPNFPVRGENFNNHRLHDDFRPTQHNDPYEDEYRRPPQQRYEDDEYFWADRRRYEDPEEESDGFYHKPPNFPESLEALGANFESMKIRNKRSVLEESESRRYPRRNYAPRRRPRQQHQHHRRFADFNQFNEGFWEDVDTDFGQFGQRHQPYRPQRSRPQQQQQQQPQYEYTYNNYRQQSHHRDPYPQQSVQSYPYNSNNNNNGYGGESYEDRVDNEILGSGNFEVIKGGTFYDADTYYNTRYNSRPHSNNGDFFENFRDFADIKGDLYRYNNY